MHSQLSISRTPSGCGLSNIVGLLLNSVLNQIESVNSEMIIAWIKVLLHVMIFAKNANSKIEVATFNYLVVRHCPIIEE